MTVETRRRIVERVLARLESHGAEFETEPQFLSHVEDWIEGRIDMPEPRARYVDFLHSRRNGDGRGASQSLVAEPQFVGLDLQGAERREEAHAEQALVEPSLLGDHGPDVAADDRTD